MTRTPESAIFRAFEPNWMARFRELIHAGHKEEAMKVIDTALPAPPEPVAGDQHVRHPVRSAGDPGP